MKSRLLLLFLFISTLAVFAADEEEEEKIQSLREERRELLLYGIDTQVIELIEEIIEEKNDSLVGEVLAAFKLTKNPRIKISTFAYFTSIENFDLRDEALFIVDSWDLQDAELLSTAVQYLIINPDPELTAHLEPLLESEDQSVMRVAIKGLGYTGNDQTVGLFLEYLDDVDFSQNLKPELILALGEMKNQLAVEPLLEILEDDGEEPTWRRFASISLGKIGDPVALPAIRRVMYDEDPIMRSYAVGSLQYFVDEDIVPDLIEALKDSFWRVRVNAAKGLGEIGNERAVPILIFKANKDPEMNVKEEAVKALGQINSINASDALKEIYGNELSPLLLRVTAVEILAKNDLAGSLELFTEVINKNWEKKGSRILERTAYYLSVAESAELTTLYSRFLDSGDLVIIIYGIRGIERNREVTLLEAIEKLSGEDNHRSIRKAALSALEALD